MFALGQSLGSRIRRTSRRRLAAALCCISLTAPLALPAFGSAQTPPPPAGETSLDGTIPRHTELLGEFFTWWQPSPYDDSTADTRRATAFRGTVTPTGAAVFRHNDAYVQAINHAAAADATQSRRALTDVLQNWVFTFPDSLGPTLGGYLRDGITAGALPRTALVMGAATVASTTGSAKEDFNFPRPFMSTADRERGGLGDRSRNGENDLAGLAPELDIRRVPGEILPETGLSSDPTYDVFAGVGPTGVLGLNQSFPSGHTTGAYTIGLTLAQLLPELGPEILTRASEAGNNRIALGVHYPLDIIGGRVAGHANVAALLDNPVTPATLILPAREELVGYLEGRCAADGLGGTLAECIAATENYRNDFVDVASKEAVTDRASALRVYERRMTYDFAPTSEPGAAPTVPAHAESLLATAFPSLDAEQRRAVLAATEIDSGAPLDRSSQGWQRINLPAAMSATVRLGQDGSVVAVEPGGDGPMVIDATGASTGPRGVPARA